MAGVAAVSMSAAGTRSQLWCGHSSLGGAAPTPPPHCWVSTSPVSPQLSSPPSPAPQLCPAPALGPSTTAPPSPTTSTRAGSSWVEMTPPSSSLHTWLSPPWCGYMPTCHGTIIVTIFVGSLPLLFQI